MLGRNLTTEELSWIRSKLITSSLPLYANKLDTCIHSFSFSSDRLYLETRFMSLSGVKDIVGGGMFNLNKILKSTLKTYPDQFSLGDMDNRQSSHYLMISNESDEEYVEIKFRVTNMEGPGKYVLVNGELGIPMQINESVLDAATNDRNFELPSGACDTTTVIINLRCFELSSAH